MRILLFILALFFFIQSSSQELPAASKWKRKLQAGFNVNGASFSDNWKAGGVTSASWNGLLNYKADFTAGRIEWSNDLQTLYGSVKLKGIPVRKSGDRIFFESKLSYKLTEIWRLFGSSNFMSQFDAGYTYDKAADGSDSIKRVSNFLSPGYLTEAIGVEYKPVPWFFAQLGFIGLRQTFVTDQGLYDEAGVTKLYGVEKGEKHREQIVFQFIADFDKEIMKNVTLKARYLLIGDYAKLEGKYLVNRLDANLIAKVNRYVNVSLGAVMLYDIDLDKDVQYSQQVSIGVLYTLQNFEDKK